jgi:CheY-like chemotaxis protein
VLVRIDTAQNLPSIKGDSSQIKQLVMNLVINAAESIGEGSEGIILITTRLERFDPPHAEIEPGLYAALRVVDNGCGMDEETKSKMFDPFFTTKFTGRGLGLAAVSGIVRGHKGAIQVSTSRGNGTTFTILLPVSEESTQAPSEKSPTKDDFRGAGTILVVEDEAVVRQTAQKTLEHYGYKVVLAENGQRAVEIFSRMADEISLVLLDLTMPVMGGDKVVGPLKAIRPATPVIITSGYDQTEVLRRFSGEAVTFLQKPYTSCQLADKIKSFLDG